MICDHLFPLIYIFKKMLNIYLKYANQIMVFDYNLNHYIFYQLNIFQHQSYKILII